MRTSTSGFGSGAIVTRGTVDGTRVGSARVIVPLRFRAMARARVRVSAQRNQQGRYHALGSTPGIFL
jgi:hypothetical protein